MPAFEAPSAQGAGALGFRVAELSGGMIGVVNIITTILTVIATTAATTTTPATTAAAAATTNEYNDTSISS